MTRPLRASTARTLTRSPEPRRPLRWSIEEFYQELGHGAYIKGQRWQCLHCESGTGSAPTHHLADQAAATHWMANHNHHQETS